MKPLKEMFIYILGFVAFLSILLAGTQAHAQGGYGGYGREPGRSTATLGPRDKNSK